MHRRRYFRRTRGIEQQSMIFFTFKYDVIKVIRPSSSFFLNLIRAKQESKRKKTCWIGLLGINLNSRVKTWCEGWETRCEFFKKFSKLRKITQYCKTCSDKVCWSLLLSNAIMYNACEMLVNINSFAVWKEIDGLIIEKMLKGVCIVDICRAAMEWLQQQMEHWSLCKSNGSPWGSLHESTGKWGECYLV